MSPYLFKYLIKEEANAESQLAWWYIDNDTKIKRKANKSAYFPVSVISKRSQINWLAKKGTPISA